MTKVGNKFRSKPKYNLYLWAFVVLIFCACENPQGSESYVGRDFDPGNGNGIDIAPPSAPTLISLTGTGNSSQTKVLNWLASTDNNGIARYEIALGSTGIGAGQNDIVDFTSIGNVLSYQFIDGVDGNSFTLTSNTLYYFTVRAVDTSDNVSPVATTSFSYFTPTDFSNLVLWLDTTNIASLKQNTGCTTDVTANGDTIDCILDQSGQGNHFTSTSGSAQYSTNTINSNPAFVLENNETMETPNTALINEGDRNVKAHYIVFRTDADVTTRQTLYKEGGGTNGTAFYIEGGNIFIGVWIDTSGSPGDRSWVSFPVSANQNYVAGFNLNDSSDSFTASLNGSRVSQSALGGQSLKSHTGSISIGANDGSIRIADGSNVNINNTVSSQGEHIMYDDVLSSGELNTLEGYLACKWGLQGSLPGGHPYTVNCP